MLSEATEQRENGRKFPRQQFTFSIRNCEREEWSRRVLHEIKYKSIMDVINRLVKWMHFLSCNLSLNFSLSLFDKFVCRQIYFSSLLPWLKQCKTEGAVQSIALHLVYLCVSLFHVLQVFINRNAFFSCILVFFGKIPKKVYFICLIWFRISPLSNFHVVNNNLPVP